jgi:hypothetical protein
MDSMECPANEVPVCDGIHAHCQSQGGSNSPIILDLFDEGFHLTSVEAGVGFPVRPGTPAVQMSWTDPQYRNGWLALDRNGNGVIDDMTELFGNLTEQPPSRDPNGYRALAVFDDPANGGNGNGVIDPDDKIFSKLRVWIDQNHNGISEPNELLTLQSLGITRIDLRYARSSWQDEYGNLFRYKSRLRDENSHVDHVTFDVFLKDY